MQLNIRPMKESDKIPLMDILRRTREFNKLDVECAEEVIDAYLAVGTSSGYNIYVAGTGKSIVGYVVYGLTPLTTGTWYIYWIAVAPEEKGHGNGSVLLEAAEDRIRANGGYLILIETSGKPGYADTQRFYESRGYYLASCIKDFYAPGDDRITFEKRFR